MFFKASQKGITQVALLVFAVVGILVFILLTSTATFKNRLFYSLYKSSSTKAAVVNLEFLGNPFATTYYPNFHIARNVWDMYEFNGKIYLGSGDSGLNTGPAPFVYYDPSTNQFVTDG